MQPIDFMKKCAEHLQHYIKCYTYYIPIILYLISSVMLHAIRCATDRDRGLLPHVRQHLEQLALIVQNN